MSTENNQIIKTFVDKIKQDKLDQRRTVLSNKDQAFVNSVGELADDFNVELPASVSAIVETAEVKGEPVEYPDLNSEVPKRAALVAANVTSDEAAKSLSKQDLISLDDIGEVSADKIIAFYA